MVSPDLIALYAVVIMRAIDEVDGYINGDNIVTNLISADDTVIVSESEEQLQKLINVIYMRMFHVMRYVFNI